MSNYLSGLIGTPVLLGIAAFAYSHSSALLSYFNREKSEPSLNFSIIQNKQLIFSVKPIPIEQQDFLDETGECYTTILIKRNNNNNYEFISVDFKGVEEDRNRLIHKINKIIYRLYLFDILKDEQYILATIDCQNNRNPSDIGQHQDTTQFLEDKIENLNFARNLRIIVPAPTFVMCEYKTPCMGAQYDYGEEQFRCSMEKSQILCFHNLLGEHGTPGILDETRSNSFRAEGNRRVVAAQVASQSGKRVRQIERYHYSQINKPFYDSYSGASGMTAIQHDITNISTRAASVNAETDEYALLKYVKDTKLRKSIESGGNKNKTNKTKTNKTNKYKINKYKIKTNKYKKL